MILLDTGPIVALIDASDSEHERCSHIAAKLEHPAWTVWPVVTEAMHLLSDSWAGQAGLWDRIQTGRIKLLPLDEADHSRLRQLMEKYNDLPMDLADAALVRVAEREKIRRIFTLDRRDFSVYRPSGIGRFDIVP